MAPIGRTILLAAMTSGCATLFSDASQKVTFTANVEGAELMLNGVPAGRTPVSVTLDRDTFKELYVTVRHPSCETQQCRVNKPLNRIAILNLSSVCSWGTDALSGNLIEYSPDAYYIEMKPRAATPPTAAGSPTTFLVVNRAHVLRDVAA